jgi:sugar/nucleoside kinase (ribokinase family)
MPRFDVTIAGELNLDLILYGLPEQLTPERELLADRMMLTLGSSSAIVAHNLSNLGARVGFISKIGCDPLGQIAVERLKQAHVDVSRLWQDENTGTGLSVILQRAGWRNILTYLGTIAELKLVDLDLDYLADSRHFHYSSFYLQRGLQSDVPELFRRLKELGVSISLDTNDDPDDCWQGGLMNSLKFVDVFLPNEREAQKIGGGNDLETAVSRLAEIVPVVVVKMGQRGAMARCGKGCITSAAITLEPVDAVGAGDSFNAGFLSQYVRGADLETCLAYGNLAGALSTTRPGGTEAFRDSLQREAFLKTYANARGKKHG